MIRPPLKEVISLGNEYKCIPISMDVFADMETPIRLLKKLEKLSNNCFLLESVEGGEKWGRYSFIGYDPYMTITVTKNETVITSKDGTKKTLAGDPVEIIRSQIKAMKGPAFDYLPRFSGGLVGYFGYDFVRYFEQLPDNDADNCEYPDCSLMAADKLIVFDNVRQKLILIVNMQTQGDIAENYADASKKLEEMNNIIISPLTEEKVSQTASKPVWSSNFTKEQFMACVEKAKVHIVDGDIFQVVLSQRFSAKLDSSLLDVYRVLRVTNPSPYMYYLKLSDIEISGASPETLLRLEGGLMETCPIAGSRPRGKTEEEDEKLADELLKDQKELSEHNMLVDLGRNDLGRVSKFGSVKVSEYLKVVRYSQIMHLTSLVTSQLKEGCDALDALASILPAGTLSGAPKVKAMEIIDDVERLRRGPYGGAVGYIGFDGNMDVCITIRTVVKKGDMAYVQAGAGIVADSVPETEYYETLNKAKAVLLAAELAGSIN